MAHSYLTSSYLESGSAHHNIVQPNNAIQHGAMAYSTPPTDLDKVRLYRLNRVKQALKANGCPAIILYDQLNCRYATDATNMQIWCSHNEARYVMVFAEGPVFLFDYGGKDVLSRGLPTIDQVRRPYDFYYMHSGPELVRDANRWIKDIKALYDEHVKGDHTIAIDRSSPLTTHVLAEAGFRVIEGFSIMEEARVIKSPEELILMQASIEACEKAIDHMRSFLVPGITENALWAKLHEGNIAAGGEWIETRLLSSGPRTNPWFQESSMRRIEKGDMVSFDTDMIGPYGYCSDISRSIVCDAKPTDAQRRLYAEAYAQIEHNRALLKPGRSFNDISYDLRKPPPEFSKVRYGIAMHGVGLCDEYPVVFYPDDVEERGFAGELQPGMCICVEALVGLEGEGEAVKLEEQVVITETGYRQLSSYPMETDWL